MNVFALIAAVIFLLELLGVDFGPDMTVLGLLFVALALAWGLVVPLGRRV